MISFIFYLLTLTSRTYADSSQCFELFKDERVQINTSGRAHKYVIGEDGTQARVRIVNSKFLKILFTQNPSGVIEFLDLLLRNNNFNEWFESILRLQLYYNIPDWPLPPPLKDIKINRTNIYLTLLRLRVISKEDGRALFAQDFEWENPESLKRHFKKHGAQEFSALNEQDYLKMANDFLKRNNDMIITVIRGDSTFIKYDVWNHDLIMVHNDTITTYYKMTEQYRPEGDFSDYLARVILDRR